MSAKDKAITFEQPLLSAASLRGCLRGEAYPITVTTSSKRFNVPAAWLGNIVRIEADGADVGYQVSTGVDATADLTVRAAESALDGNGAATLTAAANGVFRIYNGQWADVQIPLTAQTFALIGAASCVARAHLAES